MTTRFKCCLLILAALMVAVLALVEVVFHPRVCVHGERHLVGPGEEAIKLLLWGEPLREIQKAVAESGKRVDDIHWMDESLLCWAADQERLDVAEWLLRKGANPNGIEHGESPLAAAIVRNNVPMLKLLLKWGADPDLRLPIGITPRSMAESEGNPEIIAALPPSKKGAAITGHR
jgi:ankyrin repeat protein